MAEQLVINNRYGEVEDSGLNWSRIIGMAFVIALHVAAFLLLLIPAVAPPGEQEQEQKTL
ncbi:MAG: energy transducer TonB, partial [Burkholderiales bacterium]